MSYYCKPIIEVDYSRYNVTSLIKNTIQVKKMKLEWVFDNWTTLQANILEKAKKIKMKNGEYPFTIYYRLFVRPLVVFDNDWVPEPLPYDSLKDQLKTNAAMDMVNKYTHPPEEEWPEYTIYWTLFIKMNIIRVLYVHEVSHSHMYEKLEAIMEAYRPLCDLFCRFYEEKKRMPKDDELYEYILLKCEGNKVREMEIRCPESHVKYTMRVEEDSITPFIKVKYYFRQLPMDALIGYLEELDLISPEARLFLKRDFERARLAVCHYYTEETLLEKYNTFHHFKLSDLDVDIPLQPAKMTIIFTIMLIVNYLQSTMLHILNTYGKIIDISSKTIHKDTSVNSQSESYREGSLTVEQTDFLVKKITEWMNESYDAVRDILSDKCNRFLYFFRYHSPSYAFEQLNRQPSIKHFYQAVVNHGVIDALRLMEQHNSDDLISSGNIFEIPPFQSTSNVKTDAERSKNQRSYLAENIERILSLYPELGVPFAPDIKKNASSKSISRWRRILPDDKLRVYYTIKQVLSTYVDLVVYAYKHNKWTDEELLGDMPAINDITVSIYDYMYPQPTRVISEETLPDRASRLYEIPFFEKKTSVQMDIWEHAIRTSITPVVYQKKMTGNEHIVDKETVAFYADFKRTMTVYLLGCYRSEVYVGFPYMIQHRKMMDDMNVHDIALFYHTYKTFCRYVILQNVFFMLKRLPPLFDALKQYYSRFYMWVLTNRIIMNDVIMLLSSPIRNRTELADKFRGIFQGVKLMQPRRQTTKATTNLYKVKSINEATLAKNKNTQNRSQKKHKSGKMADNGYIRGKKSNTSQGPVTVVQNQNGLNNIFAVAEQYLKDHTQTHCKFVHKKSIQEALEQVDKIFLEKNKQPKEKKGIVPTDESISFPLRNTFNHVPRETLEKMIRYITSRLPTEDIDFYDMQLFDIPKHVCAKFWYVIDSFCNANSSNKITSFLFSIPPNQRYTIYAFCDIARQHTSFYPQLILDYKFVASQNIILAKAMNCRVEELTNNVGNVVVVQRSDTLKSPINSSALGPKGIFYSDLADQYADHTPTRKLHTKQRQRVPLPVVSVPSVGYVFRMENFRPSKKYRCGKRMKKKSISGQVSHATKGGCASYTQLTKRAIQKKSIDIYYSEIEPVCIPSSEPPQYGIKPLPLALEIENKRAQNTNFIVWYRNQIAKTEKYMKSVGEVDRVYPFAAPSRLLHNIPDNLIEALENKRTGSKKVKSLVLSPDCANFVEYDKVIKGPWSSFYCGHCTSRKNVRHMLLSCFRKNCPIVPGKNDFTTIKVINTELLTYEKVYFCESCAEKKAEVIGYNNKIWTKRSLELVINKGSRELSDPFDMMINKYPSDPNAYVPANHGIIKRK